MLTYPLQKSTSTSLPRTRPIKLKKRELMEEEKEKFIHLRDRLCDYIEHVTEDQADKEVVMDKEKPTKAPEQVPQVSLQKAVGELGAKKP
jgi:hypothetical protein